MLGQHALTELIDNCRHQDAIKARLVLDPFDTYDDAIQRRMLFELNRCPDAFALPLLIALVVRHQQLADRFPTLKESIRDKAAQSPSIVVQQLKEGPELNAYLDIIETLKIVPAVPALIRILNKTGEKRVIISIIHTLSILDDNRGYMAISEFLSVGDIDISLAVVDGYGRMNDVSAVEALNRLLSSDVATIRNRAKANLQKKGDEAVPLLIENLQSGDTDRVIHSLNLLESIGDPSSTESVRQLVLNRPVDVNIRFAAYEALVQLPLRKGDYILTSGLIDEDDSIRLAAARAIDQHLDESLLNGVANLLNPEDDGAARIAKAIIDAHTERLAVQLLFQPFFKRVFIRYVGLTVVEDTRRYYLSVLKAEGIAQLATQIESLAASRKLKKPKNRICAVDDSPLILKMYQSILNELGCDPVLFSSPLDFLKWVEQHRPLAVFTDLNMPDLNGIELISRIRQRYDEKTLPVILVTTQQTERDLQVARQSGANWILPKPFNRKKIQTVLKSIQIDIRLSDSSISQPQDPHQDPMGPESNDGGE